jgi:hypothetical protein
MPEQVNEKEMSEEMSEENEGIYIWAQASYSMAKVLLWKSR